MLSTGTEVGAKRGGACSWGATNVHIGGGIVRKWFFFRLLNRERFMHWRRLSRLTDRANRGEKRCGLGYSCYLFGDMERLLCYTHTLRLNSLGKETSLIAYGTPLAPFLVMFFLCLALYVQCITTMGKLQPYAPWYHNLLLEGNCLWYAVNVNVCYAMLVSNVEKLRHWGVKWRKFRWWRKGTNHEPNNLKLHKQKREWGE